MKKEIVLESESWKIVLILESEKKNLDNLDYYFIKKQIENFMDSMESL